MCVYLFLCRCLHLSSAEKGEELEKLDDRLLDEEVRN
jgi:hypothetical protein